MTAREGRSTASPGAGLPHPVQLAGPGPLGRAAWGLQAYHSALCAKRAAPKVNVCIQFAFATSHGAAILNSKQHHRRTMVRCVRPRCPYEGSMPVSLLRWTWRSRTASPKDKCMERNVPCVQKNNSFHTFVFWRGRPGPPWPLQEADLHGPFIRAPRPHTPYQLP